MAKSNKSLLEKLSRFLRKNGYGIIEFTADGKDQVNGEPTFKVKIGSRNCETKIRSKK